MSQEHSTISIDLQQQQDYQFQLHYGGSTSVLLDEPAPLGQGLGPAPGQLLVAAVANCLADSLLFALRKFKQQAEPLRVQAHAEVGRNAEQRQRILSLHVALHLGVAQAQLQHLERILGQFEQFCTVSQSVGVAIPITVQVWDAQGVCLKG